MGEVRLRETSPQQSSQLPVCVSHLLSASPIQEVRRAITVAAVLTHRGNVFMELTRKNFSGDFLAEIVQNTHFDTRLTALEGKTGAPCLAAFFICAGSAFVNLFNQVARRAHLSDFGLQPRVKVGFLSNFAQYFYRKIYSQCLSIKLVNKGNMPEHWFY